MRLTQYFNLPSPVPFVDIDINQDTRLFLDPQRIARVANAGDPLSQATDYTIRRFSTQLCQRLIGNDLAERELGLRMLDNLNEPRETRLGMANPGYNGHGVHNHFRDEIDKAITGDLKALVTVGIFQWLGALPLFVEGFGADRMSDMTTGIIRGHLIDFTEEMMQQYSQFSTNGHHLETHTLQVWDLTANQWVERTANLPSAGGHPILLVPKEWTGKGLELYGRRYYNCQALGYIQQKLQVNNPRSGKVAKKTLEKQYPEIYPINRKTTLEAYKKGEDLLKKFIAYVDKKAKNKQA